MSSHCESHARMKSPEDGCPVCLTAKLQEAEERCELERLRLAACSTAARQNTEASIAERIDRSNPYWSASYGDVCDAVDREMAMRSSAEAAEDENQRLQAEVARLTQTLKDGHLWPSSVVWSSSKMPDGSPSRLAVTPDWVIQDLRRTATEDALRWAWNEYINSNFVIDPNGFIERGLLDLLVEK